jgi:hypothetical protein
MIQTLTIKIDLDLNKFSGASTTEFTNRLASFIESESKRYCIPSGAKVTNVNKMLNTKVKMP